MRHRPTVSRVLLETLLVGPIKGCLRTVQRGGATDWRKGLAQRATNRQQSASNRARTPETYKQGVPESSVLELTRPEQGTTTLLLHRQLADGRMDAQENG